MPATKTRSLLSQPITQTSLADTVKSKFIEAGYSSLDDYVSGTDRLLVFSYQYDPALTLGTVFLRLKLTSGLGISQQIGTAYNASTKVLSNPGTETFANVLLSTTDLDIVIYTNSNQYRFVFLGQGLSLIYTQLLGFFRPESKPAWWNESTHPYVFIARNVDPHFGTLYPTGLIPFSQASQCAALPFATLINENPATASRDIISRIPMMLNNNIGIAGFLPEDLCAFASAGTSKLDTLVVSPTEKYDVLITRTTGGSGHCMRIA